MNNRRHFLSTLLGASAASAFAQDAKLSYLGENIQFGLVTYQWGKDWDIPTIIQNCSAAKVTGVELESFTLASPRYLLIGSSSLSLPCSASCITAVAVTDLNEDPVL